MQASTLTPRPPPPGPLNYSIAGCSEHSGRYVAENIRVDCPSEQSSRWSGAHPVPNMRQWILLRLESISVLKSVTFGKFHKPHPCNMKEFKIYAGMTEDHMIEVLHTGLKNDSIPETFQVKSFNAAGISFPIRYVKIIPISAHGQSFHTSIWYVSLSGITDESYLEHVQVIYDEYRETRTIRQVLKHLRQRRLLTPYHDILARSGLQLEHPLITELHNHIVLQGNWPAAEQTLQRISQAGLFDSYLRACQPRAVWTRLHGVDADGDAPTKRGGHAMCIDHENGIIYLFGGWDGQKSMDDFWAYIIKEERWRLLSHCTSKEKNGPGARSCHKMVYDTKTGCIYVLGRLSDGDVVKQREEVVAEPEAGQQVEALGMSLPPRQSVLGTGDSPITTAFCSEFYRYHTRGLDAGKWDLLSFDTASSGGPPLVFDHQMAMDCEAQILYVFGGRVVDGDWDSVKYSGLYSYNVRMSKWRVLQPSDSANPSQMYIPPRFGHSMVLEPSSRVLFIFAGQRDSKYRSDMFAYDIMTNAVTELYSNFSTAGGPDACFTQRAVIDPTLKELYVFCGLTRSQPVGSETILQSKAPNWVYRYDTRPGQWTRILREDDRGDGRIVEEPLPRYAHQVVYDPNTRTVFMHGGNAGIGGAGMERRERMSGSGMDGEEGDDASNAGEAGEASAGDAKERARERRLDDFWCMRLRRPAADEIIRRTTYQIRQQQFREMCEELSPVRALNFLQTEVFSVVDHSNSDEAESFRSLLSYLLVPTSPTPSHSHSRAPSSVPKTAKLDNTTDSPPPPRKRTRPNTPIGSWTSKFDEDEIMSDFACSAPPLVSNTAEHRGPVQSINAQVLRSEEDEEERKLRDGMGQAVSGLKFAQRTDVFEELLKFIAEENKQPSRNLLDIVDRDPDP